MGMKPRKTPPQYDLRTVTVVVNDMRGQELLSYEIMVDTTAEAVVTSDLSDARKAYGALQVVGDWAEPLKEFLLEVLKRRIKELE